MPGRDMPGDRDPDDWFAGLEPAPAERFVDLDLEAPTSPSVVNLDDDWLEEDVRAEVRRSSAFAALPDRWVAIGGVVLLAACALAGALVFAGVFGSSKKPAAIITKPPVTTRPTGTATTPKTTTQAVATVPAPTATSKPGDQGADVKALQRALASLGDSPGKIDGIYGPVTTDAVKQFQTAAKITVDGIVGPVTLAALVHALANPSSTG